MRRRCCDPAESISALSPLFPKLCKPLRRSNGQPCSVWSIRSKPYSGLGRFRDAVCVQITVWWPIQVSSLWRGRWNQVYGRQLTQAVKLQKPISNRTMERIRTDESFGGKGGDCDRRQCRDRRGDCQAVREIGRASCRERV